MLLLFYFFSNSPLGFHKKFSQKLLNFRSPMKIKKTTMSTFAIRGIQHQKKKNIDGQDSILVHTYKLCGKKKNQS